MVVSRMKMADKDKERIRACLIVNDVLSIADAQAKRFAMMNEVALTCDEATELGRLLDAAPMISAPMPHAAPMGWPGAASNGFGAHGAMSVGGRY